MAFRIQRRVTLASGVRVKLVEPEQPLERFKLRWKPARNVTLGEIEATLIFPDDKTISLIRRWRQVPGIPSRP